MEQGVLYKKLKKKTQKTNPEIQTNSNVFPLLNTVFFLRPNGKYVGSKWAIF